MEKNEEENTISKLQAPRTAFRFIRDGIEEDVKPEKWRWLAFYGSAEDCIKQFDEETGIFHQFKEIDQSRLDYFAMQSAEDPRKIFILKFKPGMKLIHYYKNTVLNALTEQEVRIKWYYFGYEELIAGKTRKTIMTIFPDDSLHINTEEEEQNAH